MSFLSLAAQATLDPGWVAAWEDLDVEFRQLLTSRGLHKPLTWAGLRGDRDRLMQMLSAMGMLEVEPLEATERVDACVALQRAALPVGDRFTDGLALQSDLQASVDRAQADKRKLLELSLIHISEPTRPY